MPGQTGIYLLEQLHARNQDIEFLMLTGQGTIETAKEAIQKGAFDYLTKPVDPAHLRHLLNMATERLESRRTMFRLRRVLQPADESLLTSMLVPLPQTFARVSNWNPTLPRAAATRASSDSARTSAGATASSAAMAMNGRAIMG